MKPVHWQLPALDWAAIDAIAAGRRIVADSRLVQAGDTFMAFQGEYADGRRYIPAALAAGAACVLWEQEDFSWDGQWHQPNLAIPQLRAQAGLIASHLLGDPSQSMYAVGVTGTNGKTSCAHWLAQAFGMLGNKAALLGTLGYGFVDQLAEASHTTPDAVRLQNLLASFRQQGASHVCMEVSSHGLMQARAHGVAFDAAIFTNLTRDHLDYHGDMVAYGAAKAQLFDWEGLSTALINADDPFGAQLLQSLPKDVALSYGIGVGDIRAESLQLNLAGMQLLAATPWGSVKINSSLVGRFNVYNLLACLGVLLRAGVPLQQAAAVLGKIESAKGRMQRLGGENRPLVVIDYAHTPDALEKALSTLRATMPEGRQLLCVFGCGGDRDKGKRPEMGRIAAQLADRSIVTSDNPRTESAQAILDDILAGMPRSASVEVEADRAKAIAQAITQAVPGDVVLIAGKGHEEYQDIGGVKTPFSDEQQATLALQAWRTRA